MRYGCGNCGGPVNMQASGHFDPATGGWFCTTSGRLFTPPPAVERTEPAFEEQLSKLLQLAIDNHYDTAARLIAGLRKGTHIVAPNVTDWRVDL